ncbi:MAG: cation:dicarboxylase symporter family transporter [Planctomycetota bacterium]|nr:cation:dicarboxylase symporter family transporter [Planctomycetota bacterium]
MASHQSQVDAALGKSTGAWWSHLYVQVLIGVVLGIAVGALFPDQGKMLKPLGDGFIKLVKMLVAPVVFCTIVHGIASVGDLRKIGRVGIKALFYFEIVSTLALILGMIVVNWAQPGAGFNTESAPALAIPVPIKESQGAFKHLTEFVINIIPETLFVPFVSGDLLQVLMVSVLTALSIAAMGSKGQNVLMAIDMVSSVLFGILNIVIKAAPIGAFGAMAFTVGNHGLEALRPLFFLMLCFYATAIFFVIVVLGSIARVAGFSIFGLLAFIRDEILLVIGTSSSETALPGLMGKMKRLGCAESTVGLVVPSGYSFNSELIIAMLTSKGSSGVTGSGFIILGATLAAVPAIPASSISILVGIDRFMSECRAITNLIGNGVATIVVSRWEGEVSADELKRRLAE